MPTVDIAGMRFGRLIAVAPTPKRLFRNVIWHCVCDCGGEIDTAILNLRSGSTRSCGCLRTELNRQKITKAVEVLREQAKSPLKRCSVCGQERSRADDFHKSGRYKTSVCRPCANDARCKRTSDIDDAYVAQMLRTKSKDVPSEIFDMKREQIRLHRLAKQLEQAIKEKS